MNTLADALIDAMAYVNMPSADSDREDEDCREMECICQILDGCSKAEQKALIQAAERAIEATRKAKKPDQLLLGIYQEILSELRERF